MNRRKFIIFICVLVSLTLFLTACPSPFAFGKHPTEQPGTTWRSSDGRVTFYIHADKSVTGTIIAGEDTIDIELSMWNLETGIGVYMSDDRSAVPVEEWQSQVISDSEFHVTVVRAKYLEQNETLVFYRVD